MDSDVGDMRAQDNQRQAHGSQTDFECMPSVQLQRILALHRKRTYMLANSESRQGNAF